MEDEDFLFLDLKLNNLSCYAFIDILNRIRFLFHSLDGLADDAKNASYTDTEEEEE